jgi:hypothetical protein
LYIRFGGGFTFKVLVAILLLSYSVGDIQGFRGFCRQHQLANGSSMKTIAHKRAGTD